MTIMTVAVMPSKELAVIELHVYLIPRRSQAWFQNLGSSVVFSAAEIRSRITVWVLLAA